MIKALDQLIDKKDNFEIVRDNIAAILKLNFENQKNLAAAAGKNTELWDARVFSERANPFEEFQNAEKQEPPIVNVWFDSSSDDDHAGDTVERQKTSGVYNIDCYAMGISQEQGTGHTPGDYISALEIHRVVRLVRNILMSAENTYLQMRGTVWRRKVTSINIFQPAAEDVSIQNIIGARIAFRVEFNEFSPQYIGEELKEISIQVQRAENGEILLELEYHENGQ